MKAVIDRFEGDFAVVLVGEEEINIEVPKSLLPEGAKEGSWLMVNMGLDSEGEARQREKISSLLDKLKNKQR